MLLELELVGGDGTGVAVVDDEPGAGGALVDRRRVNLPRLLRRRHTAPQSSDPKALGEAGGVSEPVEPWEVGGVRTGRQLGAGAEFMGRGGGSDWAGGEVNDLSIQRFV